MPTKTVEFEFVTGLKRPMFRNACLRGSWDGNGRYSDNWTESPMQEVVGEDGCPTFTASISLDRADEDKTFKWGLVLDGPQGSDFWGIPTEAQDANSAERYRQFRLHGGGTPQIERYFFTYCRRLGANQHFAGGGAPGEVLLSGRPMLKALKLSLELRTAVILPMTAPGLIPRSR